MNDTFHHFLDLPWELRDQIWSLAIRPALPGVHIFQVYDLKKDNGVGKSIEVFHPNNSDKSHRLAAPKSSAGITQNRNNPSTYLIDGGLWSACKESRLVMQRNFSGIKWQTLYDNDWESFRSMPFEEKLDMPATGYFTVQGGDAHFFTVFPHQDLFILRPQNLDTIDWSRLADRLPLASATDGFWPVKNIALEYDGELGADMVDKVANTVFEVVTLTNVWIVDYRVRRSHADGIGKFTDVCGENVAFYLKGRRLVEVDCYGGKDKWKTIANANNTSVEEVGKTEIFSDSIYFINDVYDCIVDYEEREGFQGTNALIRIGLLGCDCL